MRFIHPVEIAACLAFVAGCTTSSYVRSQAARDFHCPEDHVQTTPTGVMYRATGCGRDVLYSSALSSPSARAAFDLQCPVEQLHMVNLGHETVGVDGCGRRGSYALVDGEWVGSPSH